MKQEDFIIELLVRVDDQMQDAKKHPQALLFPSEIVTLALVFAIKGGSCRAFYRFVKNNFLHLFPQLPERTRLFRLFASHQHLRRRFLAQPTILGVADSYGIELIHPRREKRSAKQIGKKGKSNQRWIIGVKLCVMLNKFGLVVDFDSATANVYDSHFHRLIEKYAEQMVVLADSGFHAKEGDPKNLKVCQRGSWNVPMVVETFNSMVTQVFGAKKMGHRVWKYVKARLSYVTAAFNILATWHGLEVSEDGMTHLSIAEFSL
jgi:hypothetical protein